MNEDGIRLLLTALGAKQIAKKGKWVSSTCPLAPFTHKGGKDEHPSFGVRIDSNHFNCFACEKGTLGSLLHSIAFHLSKVPSYAPKYDLKTAWALLDGASLDFVPLPNFETTFSQDQVFSPWPDNFLDKFGAIDSSPEAVEYLLSREGSLTLEQAKAAEFRFDHSKQMIVCPYRNSYGTLAGARGRSIDPDCPKAYRHFDYYWNKTNNAPLVWYNEPALNLEGSVIVVEGQFDCRHVEKVWPKVVANLTAKPTMAKLRKLTGCDSVILMMDNDETGEIATRSYKEYLHDKVKVGVLEYPKQFHDPAQVDLAWLSDALSI